MNVKTLRKHGWAVSIRHFRNVNYAAKKSAQMVLVDNYTFRHEILDKDCLNKGGKTVVTLSPPGNNNTEYYAESDCSPLDNFNRHEGVRLALGRAQKKSRAKLTRILTLAFMVKGFGLSCEILVKA